MATHATYVLLHSPAAELSPIKGILKFPPFSIAPLRFTLFLRNLAEHLRRSVDFGALRYGLFSPPFLGGFWPFWVPLGACRTLGKSAANSSERCLFHRFFEQ